MTPCISLAKAKGDLCFTMACARRVTCCRSYRPSWLPVCRFFEIFLLTRRNARRGVPHDRDCLIGSLDGVCRKPPKYRARVVPFLAQERALFEALSPVVWRSEKKRVLVLLRQRNRCLGSYFSKCALCFTSVCVPCHCRADSGAKSSLFSWVTVE